MDKENATFVGTCQFAIQLTSIKLSQLASILSDFDRTKKTMMNGTDRLALMVCLTLAGAMPEVTEDERNCLGAALMAIKAMEKINLEGESNEG